MEFKFLVLFDTISLLAILSFNFKLLLWPYLLIISAFYLVLKGIVFWGDILSFIDIATAFYIILMLFGLNSVLVYFFIAYLFYKVVISIGNLA